MYIYICIYVYIFVSYPETMYNIILTFSLPCKYVYNSYLQNLHLYLYIYMHRKISDSRPTQIHVMAFKCEGLQGSNIRPSESFFRALRKKMSYLRKVRGNLLFWIIISTRCIVPCSSLRGYDHDIVPWILLVVLNSGWSLSEVSRNKAQMQQPSFQKRCFARANHLGLWCILFVWSAPCWWLRVCG